MFSGLIPDFTTETVVSILEMIWIDLLLSGDNAVVIALACRSLPPEQKRWGMILGTTAAVVLRIFFALIITQLMGIPGLKMVGGILLMWVAVKLFKPHEHSTSKVESKANLWGAVYTIAIADAVMSLDNVLALAGAAGGHLGLFILGVLISIPLIVIGSAFFIYLLSRWPWLTWFGAGLLGWIAGELITRDPLFGAAPGHISYFWGPIFGAAMIIILGWVLNTRSKRKKT
jgi:YjbE family integral membrane protein